MRVGGSTIWVGSAISAGDPAEHGGEPPADREHRVHADEGCRRRAERGSASGAELVNWNSAHTSTPG